MDRQQLIDKVIDIGPWFHNIEVGEGVRTREVAPLPGPQPDDHPRRRWADLTDAVPADLTGKRILDIGCADGFFTLELARRGASEVVSVDPWKKHINRVEWLRDLFGLHNITPMVGSLERMTAKEGSAAFDFVFMLGLLYHLKDPLTGLEAASKLTDVLYLESIAIFDEENPHLHLKPPQEGVHSVSKWIPTTRCIKDMLREVGFNSVEEITLPYHSRPEDMYRERPIYLACKDVKG